MSSKVFIPAVFVSVFRLCVPVGTLQGANSEKYHPVHREQAAPGQKSYSQGHIG